MNLDQFTSSLPKPWLNIQCDTLNTRIRSSLIDISNGPISTNDGTGTLNITPANLVSCVIGATGSTGLATLTIQLPTAAAINTYLGTLPAATNTSFKFTICSSGETGPATKVNVLMGSGISTFNGGDLLIQSGVQKKLIFSKSGSNWIIYF